MQHLISAALARISLRIALIFTRFSADARIFAAFGARNDETSMASGERIFVEVIRRYCAERGITVDVRSGGWLIAMRRGSRRHFAFGYDVGLNSAIAHRLANDKSATAEALTLAEVPCVPHRLFLNPKLGVHVAGADWREEMLALLAQNPQGVVVKPNEGTSGRSVFKVTTEAELDRAASEVFSMSTGLVISPYVAIEQEVRVVLLDDAPLVVYSKQRGSDWRHNPSSAARIGDTISMPAQSRCCWSTAQFARPAQSSRSMPRVPSVLCSLRSTWFALPVIGACSRSIPA